MAIVQPLHFEVQQANPLSNLPRGRYRFSLVPCGDQVVLGLTEVNGQRHQRLFQRFPDPFQVFNELLGIPEAECRPLLADGRSVLTTMVPPQVPREVQAAISLAQMPDLIALETSASSSVLTLVFPTALASAPIERRIIHTVQHCRMLCRVQVLREQVKPDRTPYLVRLDRPLEPKVDHTHQPIRSATAKA